MIRRRHYTTPSTVPESVRPSLWRDWRRFCDRLMRRFSGADRRLELQSGTGLVLEGTELRLSYEDRSRTFVLRLASDLAGEHEVRVAGCSAFGCGRPHVFADELQDAVDRLTVLHVMSA